MEQTAQEQIGEAVKCQNIQTTAEKLSDLQSDIVSWTPAKVSETLPGKCKTEATELPEKYKIISEFFDRMTSSLRLLSLRKKSPTFQNICTQVQTLTKRKFLYKHLAQIKYILPEAVQTERILIHNEKTMCMEPEMKITLLFDIVKGHDEDSDYLALCMLFTSRLFNFLSTCTEGFEIPEAVLPEPFNKQSISITREPSCLDSSAVSPPNVVEIELSNSTHLHLTFSKHFSQKETTEKTPILASTIPVLPIKCDSLAQEDTESQIKALSSSVESTSPINPVDSRNSPCFSSITCESTPIKFTTEPKSLMVETPAQLTPQRSLPIHDKVKTTPILQQTSNMSAKRTLDFSHPEGECGHLNFSADGRTEQEEVAPYNPVRETKGKIVENNAGFLDADVSKGSNYYNSNEKTIMNQSGSTSCQQMSLYLPYLVANINKIFQYANCSSITKEELVHKIIMNTLDIVERREVEEQIDLLEKLVPDWIAKRLAPSGDILYSIKRVSDLKGLFASNQVSQD